MSERLTSVAGSAFGLDKVANQSKSGAKATLGSTVLNFSNFMDAAVTDGSFAPDTDADSKADFEFNSPAKGSSALKYRDQLSSSQAYEKRDFEREDATVRDTGRKSRDDTASDVREVPEKPHTKAKKPVDKESPSTEATAKPEAKAAGEPSSTENTEVETAVIGEATPDLRVFDDGKIAGAEQVSLPPMASAATVTGGENSLENAAFASAQVASQVISTGPAQTDMAVPQQTGQVNTDIVGNVALESPETTAQLIDAGATAATNTQSKSGGAEAQIQSSQTGGAAQATNTPTSEQNPGSGGIENLTPLTPGEKVTLSASTQSSQTGVTISLDAAAREVFGNTAATMATKTGQANASALENGGVAAVSNDKAPTVTNAFTGVAAQTSVNSAQATSASTGTNAPQYPAPASQIAPHLVALKTAPDGTHRMTLMLNPEQLGPVQVIAELRNGEVRVEFIGATDIGRDALKAALPDLKKELQSAGLNASSLDVRADLQGREQNMQQSQGTADNLGRERGTSNYGNGERGSSPANDTNQVIDTNTGDYVNANGVDIRV